MCAAWNDQGKVQIWNLASALRSLESMQSKNESVKISEKPLFTFSGHGTEGYAMDWSPKTVGKWTIFFILRIFYNGNNFLFQENSLPAIIEKTFIYGK